MTKFALFSSTILLCGCAHAVKPSPSTPTPITLEQAFGLGKGPSLRPEDATSLPGICGLHEISIDEIGGPAFTALKENMGDHRSMMVCDGFSDISDTPFKPDSRIKIDDKDYAIYKVRGVLACPILDNRPGSCASTHIDTKDCCELIGIIKK